MNQVWHNITTWFDSLSTTAPQTGLLVGAFAVGTILFLLLSRRLNRRVKPFAERLTDVEQQLESDGKATFFDTIASAFAVRFSESRKGREDFKQLLRGAGLYDAHAATHFYAMRFLFLAAPLLAAGLLALQVERAAMTPLLLGGLFVGACLSIVPRLYVYFLRRTRTRNIRHGLPDAMDMLSMCVGGGMPLSVSLDHVARQLGNYPELAEELLILKRQSEVGSLKLALNDFAARVDLPETRQLAGLLTRGERLGTKLAGTLTEHSDHLRQARKQFATSQANKTPVKLVLPLLFCFAPAALLLLVGPAILELKEFVAPTKGSSVLTNNSTLGARPVTETLRILDGN